MANHKSAEKRVRQSEKRRAINRGNRTKVRTYIKKLRGALESGSKQDVAVALPQTISVDDGDIVGCHGTPTDDRTYLLETPENGRLRLASPDEVESRLGDTIAQIVACAHSHMPRLVHAQRRVIAVNPGSVGLQAYQDNDSDPHVSETGSPCARYAFLESQGRHWRATFVTVQYDHAAASRQAAANGRADWAFSLRTGYASSDGR